VETPRYLQLLGRQKVLLIVGLVVAIAAGLIAGFTLKDGAVAPRVDRTYTAMTTVYLSGPQPYVYQIEIPAQGEPITEATDQQVIVRPTQEIDLTDSAVILAYLASSNQTVDMVEAQLGPLADGEGVTAVSRTTQPAGDERFPGRMSLPLIGIVGTATSPERAEEISTAATEAFEEIVLTQQDELAVPEDVRLNLDVLTAAVSDEGEGSNPLIPVVVTTFAVFLLFLGIALLVGVMQDRRRAKRDAATEADPDADAALPADDDGAAPSASAPDRQARRRPPAEPVTDPDAEVLSGDEDDTLADTRQPSLT